MSIKEIREINRFEVMSDKGNRLFIIEYQEFIDAGAGDHPNNTVPSLKYYKTIEEIPVNSADGITFNIPGSDGVYHKI